MASVKAWKAGDPQMPAFPEEFELVSKAVLQVTDIRSNRNKYYAIELHSAERNGTPVFRVFTHYGRTDDLETNPEAGQRESRFFDTQAEAEAAYQSIYREKTSPKKGYKEISLASSRIGSSKARGKSSGEIDDATLKKATQQAKTAVGEESKTDETLGAPTPSAPAETAPTSWTAKIRSLVGQALGTPAEEPAPAPTAPGDMDSRVAELVDTIYREATTALTSTVAAKITAEGIETPLGVLTLGQIQKGEAILQDLYALFQKKSKARDQTVELSGEFYTAIPHRIGRSRAAVEAAVIDSMEAFEQKQETLQLMKDMLQVNGEGNVLFHSQSRAQYEALRCEITWVDPADPTYREIRDYVLGSQVKSKSIRVGHVFTLRRESEWRAFTSQIDNQRLLFHGSRIKNWVGILSRGILLPKIVVSMGVGRTDAGWLGNGIYFGDAACTSAFYTSPGRNGKRYMSLARVALGKMKDYTQITYGLSGPPSGFDSCHGVRSTALRSSQFADDEYVVYNSARQRLEYLVEFTV